MGNASDEFVLDTGYMDQAAKDCDDLANLMRDLKLVLYQERDSLMEKWKGDGANAFSKKFQVLCQQFGDLTDELHALSESILTAEESYIEADVQGAKAIDGTHRPEDHYDNN